MVLFSISSNTLLLAMKPVAGILTGSVSIFEVRVLGLGIGVMALSAVLKGETRGGKGAR